MVIQNNATNNLGLTLAGVVVYNSISGVFSAISAPTGQILSGAGTGLSPTFLQLTSAGGTISITPTATSINLETLSVSIFGGNGITVSGLTISLVTPVTIANGGTNTTSFPATNGVVYFDGTKLTDTLASTASGQFIFTNATAGPPSFGTLTSAGGSIIVTPTATGINIDTVGGGIPWVDVTAASKAMAVETGYVADNTTTAVLFTLPATATFGSIIRVVGNQSTGWQILQNAGQLIHYCGATTTTGTNGSLASVSPFDFSAVELLCTATNTTFVVVSAMGNVSVT